jgi:hypothetical protein
MFMSIKTVMPGQAENMRKALTCRQIHGKITVL